MSKKFTIALVGNPNCGKTTLFNALTGSNQRVGNWPGVTVEHLEGVCKNGDSEYTIIDLPGIYSFSAYTLDEKVAREFILNEKPDLVINIVDASNLERNLYLTTQLIEMKTPTLVVLNMMDVAKRNGVMIEVDHLASHLDCPVIPIVANRKTGIDLLLKKIEESVAGHKISSAHVAYDPIFERSLKKIDEKAKAFAEENEVDCRWLTVKLFEQDDLAKKMTNDELNDFVAREAVKIKKHTGEDSDIVAADGRYGFIHGLARDVIKRNDELNKTFTDNVDKIVLNRFLGIPIFLGVTFLMFLITMKLSEPFIDFFDRLCGTIFVDGMRVLLVEMNFSEFLVTLLAEGVGGGIQTIATFIPPIGLMFLCLSFLEDSGYMARAAFVMDRPLNTIGLPGKAFIPMLIGFGCNVPGVMATRTLENKRDRLLSVLINPFFSCGARMPIYVMFASAFFRYQSGPILFGLYFSGVFLAIMSGLLFGKTILKGEISRAVMELPPYHLPTFRGVMFHTWHRLKSFVVRAGKVIILFVICLSFLNSVGTDGSFGNEDSEKSILSSLSKKITPVFYPMGITAENWPATVGLCTGIFAKETVVSTIKTLYMQMDGLAGEKDDSKQKFDFWAGIADAFKAIPDGFKNIFVPEEIDQKVKMEFQKDAESTFVALRKHFPGRASAIAYMLFILIYAPCLAVIAAIYRETNLKWTIFSVGYLTALAWIVSTIFYQVSRLTLTPQSALPWLAFCIVIIAVFVFTLKKIGNIKIEK